MNSDFEKKYQTMKKWIEEIDPAGLGAEGEYDDILFQIARANSHVSNKNVFVQNTAHAIADALGLETQDVEAGSLEFMEKVFTEYPNGL